ncbi:antirestriction protein [Parahaliea maris]|uniref:Antirestriction protein n=1 Tax=Parahaliea maris TaxID=2716870 RepID=A0A5C8ZQN2_9GAMM|nr:antirestriction protein [Parahaliea maris]TXS90806.1 antirestriction protein [Parahaliea maris]
MSGNESNTTVTATLILEEQRLDFIGNHFGATYPLLIEPTIYSTAEKLTNGQYHGGYWLMYQLSNGGFYTAPDDDRRFQLSCENYWSGELSADALGITVCLYAFSRLSYAKNVVFGKLCAENYYWLRDYVYEHPEAAAILGATD